MLKDLTLEQREFANLMMEISERCYYAGWIANLEYVLWHAMKNGERKYGHDSITKSDIHLLAQISTILNTWIYMDDITEETAITLDKWEKKYQFALDRNSKILTG
jgi:hypothetical protein